MSRVLQLLEADLTLVSTGLHPSNSSTRQATIRPSLAFIRFGQLGALVDRFGCGLSRC